LPLVDFGEDKVVGLRLSGDREALQKESHLQRKAQGWDKVVEEGRVGIQAERKAGSIPS
jgi:hypothetical protein